ncbi:MAG: hypothetical protein NUW02_02905 [Candidatus Campbellbacteria bacterium]|nr:hypothetical protein [Candidatus Campbellbacteria bacterium]
MNKKVIIGIVVVVVLIGGFMLSRGKSPIGGGPLGDTSDSVSSLSELMSRGKPAKCQYTMAGDGFDQTSTVYYDGKKMYMENTSTVGGQETKTNILIDENFQYMWSNDGTNQGIKIPVAKDAADPSAGINPNSQVDFGANLQMDCDRWSGNDGVFTPPSSVTFTDLSVMGGEF